MLDPSSAVDSDYEQGRETTHATSGEAAATTTHTKRAYPRFTRASSRGREARSRGGCGRLKRAAEKDSKDRIGILSDGGIGAREAAASARRAELEGETNNCLAGFPLRRDRRTAVRGRACAANVRARADVRSACRFEGEWLKGSMHGTGTFLWPDGRRCALLGAILLPACPAVERCL